MKVQFATTPIPSFDRIRTAESGRDAPKRDSHDSSQKKDEPEDETEFSDIAKETLANAVQSFGQDTAVSANGLSAEVAGKGPGLRVTLKDGRGAVVRQFTGEEFLRLREAAGTGRGSLLDKKI